MDAYRLLAALKLGRPYFGPALASSQGVPIRHAYMTAIVSTLTRAGRTPCNILEIGAWAGGSTVTWARALETAGVPGRVVCVDTWQARFNTSVNTARVYEEMNAAVDHGLIEPLFRHNIRTAGVEHLVVPIRGASGEVLPLLGADRFQVVFIDGSHLYADVIGDLTTATPLVANGGVICGDDLELQRDDCDEIALRDAIDRGLDYTVDPRTGTWYHPGVTLAIAERLNHVTVWEGFWAAQRQDEGWQHLDIGAGPVTVPEHLRHVEACEPVLIEASVRGFNILAVDGSFVGVPSSLGPLSLTDPNNWRRTYEQAVVASTIEDVRDAIQARDDDTCASARSLAGADVQPRVVAEYEAFNIVSFRHRYYAVAQSAGPVNFESEQELTTLGSRGLCFVRASLDEARLAVDAAITTRRMQDAVREHQQGVEILRGAQATLGAALSDILARLDSARPAAHATAADQTQRLAALEGRLGEFATRLDVAERLSRLEDQVRGLTATLGVHATSIAELGASSARQQDATNAISGRIDGLVGQIAEEAQAVARVEVEPQLGVLRSQVELLDRGLQTLSTTAHSEMTRITTSIADDMAVINREFDRVQPLLQRVTDDARAEALRVTAALASDLAVQQAELLRLSQMAVGRDAMLSRIEMALSEVRASVADMQAMIVTPKVRRWRRAATP